ncbi:TetR/AcrR family transcriptional regulator [Nocardia sp. BSTN01]|uniref:TetR/AcrR family transcriptional regulator n=1 Tax=Nocardia sp. BSTN01 TaxID=2783665 RepID=UPI00188DDFE3|nr:TetR/AcrR family transcriptional regulator [Nocardia sp. BSTN01]MBF4999581.1 TetR/AcrR family transcriptional regulator [Nocardia sp. BSTN01]
MTGLQRREHIRDIARDVFAEFGYSATSTDMIARGADVSQAYVIRLFGSKRQLFLMGLEQAWDGLEAIVRGAWLRTNPPAETRDCRAALLEDPILPMLIQGFAESADPVIGASMRDRCGDLYRLLLSHPRASAAEARRFLAECALMGALVAIRDTGADDEPAPGLRELFAAFGIN